jgi:hypothetical protein
MTSKSDRKPEIDQCEVNCLKFSDDPEIQLRVRQLCGRLAIDFDRTTALILWARIGLKLALDQPEFQNVVRKRKGRPPGARKSLNKWSVHDRAFVRFVRLEATETGVPVCKLISSAVYGARKFHATGKPPPRDKSHGLWECLRRYKDDRAYDGLKRRLLRCNDAYEAKLIEELLSKDWLVSSSR